MNWQGACQQRERVICLSYKSLIFSEMIFFIPPCQQDLIPDPY